MDNILLIAEHSATSIEPGAWLNTTWTIYANRHVIINIRYNNNDVKDRDLQTTISEDVFEELFDTLELAKREDHKVFVFDSTEWSFKQYQNGQQIYRRIGAAIDGLMEFEKLEAIFYQIIKRAKPAGEA